MYVLRAKLYRPYYTKENVISFGDFVRTTESDILDLGHNLWRRSFES